MMESREYVSGNGFLDRVRRFNSRYMLSKGLASRLGAYNVEVKKNKVLMAVRGDTPPLSVYDSVERMARDSGLVVKSLNGPLGKKGFEIRENESKDARYLKVTSEFVPLPPFDMTKLECSMNCLDDGRFSEMVDLAARTMALNVY